jgi:hypothetical protein
LQASISIFFLLQPALLRSLIAIGSRSQDLERLRRKQRRAGRSVLRVNRSTCTTEEIGRG